MKNELGFMLYCDDARLLLKLGASSCKKVLLALSDYAKLGTIPDLQGEEKAVFEKIRASIDEDD